jgi:endonuclease/exonuclease/phosphatase family metal-dependent hydrolase
MKLATFNCENLFARYRFKENLTPRDSDGFTINQLAFEIYEEPEKQITGAAIRKVAPDVIALVEVENLLVLDRFNSRYLGGMGYRHRILIDSADPRGIDVALLSRYPIVSVCSHRHERNAANTAALFSRDCLEAEIDVSGRRLLLYVNHFKSMMEGRAETKKRREEQARRVAEIVDQRWNAVGYEGNFVVPGDLNDYPGQGTALSPLLNHSGLTNVVDRLPDGERWTHFYAGGNEYRQLDYLFLSKSLAATNTGVPQIMRMGLPHRAVKYTGERFPNVGEDNPKASDHAPVFMDIELA